MPTDKDFKRLVRARMRKTGEAYTAARAQLLQTPAVTAPPPSTPAPPPDYARLAGISDEVVKARTGCTWDRWVWVLDRAEAHTWSHREIARHIGEKYRTPDWWTQMVTVGYERIKGLRTIGQRRDGAHEANRSRTFGVPVARLYRAARDARIRKRWLPEPDLTIRTATPNRSIRLTWSDRTSVELRFTSKGAGRSQVQIQHRKLPDQESATRRKVYWGERLDALGGLLASPAP